MADRFRQNNLNTYHRQIVKETGLETDKATLSIILSIVVYSSQRAVYDGHEHYCQTDLKRNTDKTYIIVKHIETQKELYYPDIDKKRHINFVYFSFHGRIFEPESCLL